MSHNNNLNNNPNIPINHRIPPPHTLPFPYSSPPSLPAPDSLLTNLPPDHHATYYTNPISLPGPHPRFHYPSRPPPPQTLSNLSSEILTHPFFPLCFKKLFHLIKKKPVNFPSHLTAQFYNSEKELHQLFVFADTHGISRASERWSYTDVFLGAVLTALDNANAGLQAGLPFRDSVLEQTVAAAKSSLCHTHSVDIFNSTTQNTPRAPVSQQQPLRVERVITKGVPLHGRTPLTERAKALLEQWFTDNVESPYPTMNQKKELAQSCNMTMNSVNNWFGNKRMRIKRKMLSVQSEQRGTAREIGDKVLAPRSKWNAVVVSKMNSQEGKQVMASATGKSVEEKDGEGGAEEAGKKVGMERGGTGR